MTKDELYTNLLEEAVQEDSTNIHSHAYWMARVVVEVRDDPAFKKLKPALREEIETICAAVE